MKNQHIENEVNVKREICIHTNIMIKGYFIRFYGTLRQLLFLLYGAKESREVIK